VIRRLDQQTTAWSGGLTTEIAIFPYESHYVTRNFGWRISTATVDVDHSVFTPLPGIWRVLMIIEGRMVLEHEGQHGASLERFQQHAFSGAWRTESWGRAQDLNVMLSAQYRAKITAPESDDMGSSSRKIVVPISAGSQKAWELFYCVAGSLGVRGNDGLHTQLAVGDVLMVSRHYLLSALELSMVFESTHSQPVWPIRISIVGPDLGE